MSVWLLLLLWLFTEHLLQPVCTTAVARSSDTVHAQQCIKSCLTLSSLSVWHNKLPVSPHETGYGLATAAAVAAAHLLCLLADLGEHLLAFSLSL